MRVFGEPNVEIFNEELIDDDVLLNAEGIQFINTAQGQVRGQFTFGVGGSTLIIEPGGVIGGDDVGSSAFFLAIQGSAGDDTVISNGTVFGFADLGDGNDSITINYPNGDRQWSEHSISSLGAGDDVLRIEGFDWPLFPRFDAGPGHDVLQFEGGRPVDTGNFARGTFVSGFEVLELGLDNSYYFFDDFLEIRGRDGPIAFYSLIESSNPLARLELGGHSWYFINSIFEEFVGSDADEFFTFEGASGVTGTITLKGGDDNFNLTGTPTRETPQISSVAASIDGGEGADSVVISGYHTDYTDTFAHVSGLEELNLFSFIEEGRVEYRLSEMNGFDLIVISDVNADLSLVSSNSPEARLVAFGGSNVTIAADVTIQEFAHSRSATGNRTSGIESDASRSTILTNAGQIVDSVIFGSGNDLYDGTLGSVGSVYGNAGNDVILGGNAGEELFGNAGADILNGGGGDDLLDGGRNIDTAVFSGNRADYTITQTATGVFEVSGADGTDTLTTIEFAQFDDETVRLLPGEGVSVFFDTVDPAAYQSAMNAIRDFDGIPLGGDGAWLRIGSADVNGDGDIDQILVNDAIARFATVGTAPDGLVYFDDYSWAGETRVAGIYIDPLVEAGVVEQFSPNDSQQRFQNDLAIENINRVLGADDYDGDGLQDVYFALTDGTAYLRAIMEADGNIRYANYQSEEQVIEFLNANGYGEETYADWFDPPPPSPPPVAMDAGQLFTDRYEMVQAEFFG